MERLYVIAHDLTRWFLQVTVCLMTSNMNMVVYFMITIIFKLYVCIRIDIHIFVYMYLDMCIHLQIYIYICIHPVYTDIHYYPWYIYLQTWTLCPYIHNSIIPHIYISPFLQPCITLYASCIYVDRCRLRYRYRQIHSLKHPFTCV